MARFKALIVKTSGSLQVDIIQVPDNTFGSGTMPTRRQALLQAKYERENLILKAQDEVDALDRALADQPPEEKEVK